MGLGAIAQDTLDQLSTADQFSKTAVILISIQVTFKAINDLPTIKSSLATAATKAQNILLDGTKCENIARDFDLIQSSICVTLMYVFYFILSNFTSSSLDGFWLSFFILALTGLLSVFVYIATANALADVDASEYRRDQVLHTGSPKPSKKSKDSQKVTNKKIF